MKLYFLEEERSSFDVDMNIHEGNFIKQSELNNLECDLLYVNDMSLIGGFLNVDDGELFETEKIKYIVVGNIELYKLIYDNFEDISVVMVDELVKNIDEFENKNDRTVLKFFRIGDKRMFTRVCNFHNFYYVPSDEGKCLTIDNKRCSREYDYNREGLNYEKDINKYKRYSLMLSKRDKFKFNFRVMTFDLETNASVDCVNTPEPIISIASHDSLTNEMKYWDIKSHDEEEEKNMLEDFYSYCSNFDVIAGFNIVKFDLPYLINRGMRVGADVSLMSTCRARITCKHRENDNLYPWFIKIIGLNIVDLFQSSVRAIAYLDVKLPDSKLDTLAKNILGESKIEVDTPAILWKNKNFELLKEYNIQDVNIAVKLDIKLGVVDLLVSTLEFVPGLNLEEANYNSKIIDFYLLSKFSIILPTVFRDREVNVEGAIVFDPLQGIHDNVAVFDISGMYPNLIRTFNISPDCIDDEGDIILDKTRFTSSKKGILVTFVDDFMKLRKRYKKLKEEHENDKDYKLYQLREFATKKILSSVFGVFGFTGFRLFDERIANSITYTGRELLKYMKSFAESKECTIVIGDTDSIFIKSEKYKDYEKFMELCNEMNYSMKEFVSKFSYKPQVVENHKLFVEFETLFSRLIVPPAKKKYIGITTVQKGKKLSIPQLYGRGNELVKKDVPVGLKEEIKKIVMKVLESDGFINTIQIIKNELCEIKKKIYTLDVEDLLIYKEITREFNSYKVKPQHVRSAENSNKFLGTNFSRQDYKGGIIYVKSNKYKDCEVLFMNDKVKLNGDFRIDYEKYYNKFIIEKIRLIFGEDIYSKVVNKNRSIFDFGSKFGD